MSLTTHVLSLPSFPEMYERHLVGWLFRPWAEMLIERAGVRAGERVLDVACGTGIVGRLAGDRVGTTGHVVGVDTSVPMLTTARRVAPGIDWREGSAVSLPLADGEQFDVVFCHQGLQFFPDRAAALGEFRRALAPGGRLAIGVWRSDEEVPFLRELRAVAEHHLGPVDDARFGFGDARALEKLLVDAGFDEVRVEPLSATTGDDGVMYARMNAMALVGMSAVGKSMEAEARLRMVETIVEDSRATVSRHAAEEGSAAVRFEMGNNIATARV